MKSKTDIYGLIAIVAVSLSLGFIFNAYNKQIISKGVLFYDLDNQSYSYNFETKNEKKICIKGYDNVSSYTPFENGFCAIGYYDKEDQNGSDVLTGDIIYKDSKIEKTFKNEFNPKNLKLVGDYILFITGDEKLVAINKNNGKREVVDTGVNQLLIKGNCICYSVKDYNNEKNTIYYTDNIRDKIKIDDGVLKYIFEDKVVYEKNNSFYKYDFENDKSTSIEIKKKYKYREYLGNIKEKNIQIYNTMFYFGDKYAEDDFETPFRIPIFQRIVLKSNRGSQYIKVKKDAVVKVILFNEGKGYYTIE